MLIRFRLLITSKHPAFQSNTVSTKQCWLEGTSGVIQHSCLKLVLLEQVAGCIIQVGLSPQTETPVSLGNLFQCSTTLVEQYEGVLYLSVFFSVSVCAHCLLPYSWMLLRTYCLCLLSLLPSWPCLAASWTFSLKDTVRDGIKSFATIKTISTSADLPQSTRLQNVS